MTVSGQVKQTLASLKGARSTLESFAAIEENVDAKQVYGQNLQRLDRVIDGMEKRLQVLEFEEPQYKGF
ncbi:DUF1657 domain-containing protein [Heliobacterium gestii]|uniref:DUF1657 domain-containing protein n=1 Tax=Heliomicrobium gestii TaxID=2699 RepID=A0A845LIE9_HELGE|nr:DUF1657 domain-containing protein [Heliomicrobium gestii]MBM7866506.1 hypothetical protein [Heliomicrobium gestii]MZP43213.1 DUF1657 domain-containing protein [Heliomicrobium gestii]